MRVVVVVFGSMPTVGAKKTASGGWSKNAAVDKSKKVAVDASKPLHIDLSKIQKGTSRVYAMPHRTCGDGTDYVFLVTRGENAEPNKNGKFEKVMIEFMGGGGCFDYSSCMGQIPNAGHIKNLEIFAINGMSLDEVIKFSETGGLIATTTNCMVSPAGLLPCSSSKFADYVSLMIPYCTGDIHIGSQTATYYEHENTQTGASIEIRHHGANHTLDLLSAFIAAIGSPSEVRNLTVSGGSAGGWAALLWGGHIMEAFERAGSVGKLQTNVLVDSAFHVPLDKPEVAAKIFHGVKWGRVITSWQDQLIQPENVVAVLKQQLSYYGGQLIFTPTPMPTSPRSVVNRLTSPLSRRTVPCGLLGVR